MSGSSHPAAGDPLAAIGLQLVTAARRRKLRHRRRRRTALVAALVLLMLAAGAGASELAGLDTGVPAIDKLLDIEHGSGPRDIRPAGSSSDPLSAPGLAGGPRGVALAYVSRAGTICSAAAENIGERGVRGGFGACYEAADLERMLDRRGVVCCTFSAGPDDRTYAGYAAADVVAIRLLVRGGPVAAELTRPWTPKVPGGRPQRYFVAIDGRDIDVGDDGVQLDDLALIPHELPTLELDYADGRVVKWEPPGSRRRR
jgi:hypothetical protein